MPFTTSFYKELLELATQVASIAFCLSIYIRDFQTDSVATATSNTDWTANNTAYQRHGTRKNTFPCCNERSQLDSPYFAFNGNEESLRSIGLGTKRVPAVTSISPASHYTDRSAPKGVLFVKDRDRFPAFPYAAYPA